MSFGKSTKIQISGHHPRCC